MRFRTVQIIIIVGLIFNLLLFLQPANVLANEKIESPYRVTTLTNGTIVINGTGKNEEELSYQISKIAKKYAEERRVKAIWAHVYSNEESHFSVSIAPKAQEGTLVVIETETTWEKFQEVKEELKDWLITVRTLQKLGKSEKEKILFMRIEKYVEY